MCPPVHPVDVVGATVPALAAAGGTVPLADEDIHQSVVCVNGVGLLHRRVTMPVATPRSLGPPTAGLVGVRRRATSGHLVVAASGDEHGVMNGNSRAMTRRLKEKSRETGLKIGEKKRRRKRKTRTVIVTAASRHRLGNVVDRQDPQFPQTIRHGTQKHLVRRPPP